MLANTLTYGPVQRLDAALPLTMYRNLLLTSQRIGWQFGWNTPSNPNTRYWHHEIGRGNKSNLDDISANVRKHPQPIFAMYQDWLKAHLVPYNTKVLRYYLNAHTYGTDGWPHTDTDRGEELTAVLYLTGEWRPEWCGETVIFDNGGEIQASVLPKANRLLVFPSDRLHAPRPLSKAFEGLRVVLVVKLGPAAGEPDFFNQGRRTNPREDRLLAHLMQAGASKQAHSGRSLLRHLWGLYSLLKMRGASQEICEAGLFQGIYASHSLGSKPDRDEVRDLVGARAEHLAWLFCQLEKPRCWSLQGPDWPLTQLGSTELSEDDRRDLRMIGSARLAEEGVVDPTQWRGIA